jgi:signal peptidase I
VDGKLLIQRVPRALRRLVVIGLTAAIIAGPATAVVAHHDGWQPLIERTGSMAPRIAVGDLVLVQRTPAASMRAGEVITFDDPYVHGRTITHRVKWVRHDPDGHLRIMTRGDANRAPEVWTIAPTGTVGRLRATVPLPSFASSLLDRSHQRGIIMLMMSLLACGLTLWAIWRRPAAAAPCAPVR